MYLENLYVHFKVLSRVLARVGYTYREVEMNLTRLPGVDLKTDECDGLQLGFEKHIAI